MPILERLYERTGQYDELRALIAQQLKEAGGDARERALRVRLALVEHRFRRDDGAALELLSSVLDAQGDHPAALAALEEVMRSGRDTSGQAAEVLLGRNASPALQVEALEVRLAGTWGDERTALPAC